MPRYQEYFDRLAEHRVRIRKRHRYYWNEITRYCNYFSHETLSVLEIGCGTGELIGGIKAAKKTGIDFSEKMISIARRQYPDVDFKTMAAEDLELTETFDLIIVSNLIGYTDDVQRVFEQLHKVCHARTKIIVTYYNYLWEPVLRSAEFLGLKTKSPKQNWLTKADIKNLLFLSGFDEYRNTNHMLLPVYIPLLSEFLNKFLVRLPLIRLLAINHYSFSHQRSTVAATEAQKLFSVSVVIPARNESGNIENAITRLPAFGGHQEIIFVEGNSTDDTWEKIQEIQKKYSATYDIKIAKQPGKGKNDAVRKGFDMATGDILMILDADLTVPPEDLPKFYDAIATGKGDFINGCRLIYQMEKEAMRFLNLLGNKFFSIMFTFLLEKASRIPFAERRLFLKRIMKSWSRTGNFLVSSIRSEIMI